MPTVYTVNIGDYDTVLPFRDQPGWRALCFTDADTAPEGWEHCPCSTDGLPAIAASRTMKIKPWDYFDDDVSLYIDGRYYVSGDLNEMIDVYKGDWVCREHYDQTLTIYDEIRKSLSKPRPYLRDDAVVERLSRQADEYARAGMPFRPENLPSNGAILRRHTDTVRTIGDLWWKEFMRNQTWNDQVDLWFVLWASGHSVDTVPWEEWLKYLTLGVHKEWVYL